MKKCKQDYMMNEMTGGLEGEISERSWSEKIPLHSWQFSQKNHYFITFSVSFSSFGKLCLNLHI